MEKFTLINKNRSRIKVFEPFDDSSKKSSTITSIFISSGLFLSDQVSQLWKAIGLNLSKKWETNIKTIRGRAGKNL